jgi:hypothetical protein
VCIQTLTLDPTEHLRLKTMRLAVRQFQDASALVAEAQVRYDAARRHAYSTDLLDPDSRPGAEADPSLATLAEGLGRCLDDARYVKSGAERTIIEIIRERQADPRAAERSICGLIVDGKLYLAFPEGLGNDPDDRNASDDYTESRALIIDLASVPALDDDQSDDES